MPAIKRILFFFCGVIVIPLLGKAARKPDAKTVHSLLQKGEAVILDVRESEELLSGMVKGAHWVATSKVSSEHQDWTQFLLSLNKEIEIFVYCAVGGRASRVVKILRNKGFKAKNMGGFSDWAKKGLPVQKMCRSNGSVKPC